MNITREQLEDLYIKQGLSVEEIAKYFNLSGKSIRKWVKRFSLYRDPGISQKQRVRKQKKTNLEKYGVDSYSKTNGFKEKIRKTSIERYGVDNAAKSQKIKDKVKQNNLEKYGETNPLKVPEIKEKIRLEQIEKKGFAYPYQMNKDSETVKILSTKENLEEYLKSFDYKPTIDELAKSLNYHRTGITHVLHKYKLMTYIDYKPSTSSYEKFIKEKFTNFKSNIKILNNKEIDLYDDSLKLGIEFNGNYWHSIDNKGKNYHQNKTLLAKSKNIQLIHIFEYEWNNPYIREKLINMIENKVNDKRVIVYARRCNIEKIDSKLSKEFLNKYHLQGVDNASIRYGLFFEGILIGVMTFSKPRFNKKYEYELSRLCWHKDYKIVGGANKLFKTFIKDYSPKSIISYCDIGKFTGEVYNKLGFRFDHYSSPNYIWCNNKGDVKTRYQCQRHKLITQYPEFDGLTETEIMTMLGYWKVEDAGNAVYELIF